MLWNTMEERGDYEDKLRAVFDLCDVSKQGYISVAHFVDLAQQHFGAEGGEDIYRIVQLLDPEKDGKIYFDGFCEGVQQILELRGVTSSTSDLNGLHNIGSEETLVDEDGNSCGTQENSELSTYNEYDMMTDDDQVTLANNDLASTSPPQSESLHLPRPVSSEDDRDSAISGRSSECQDPRRELEITDDEEKFEDYGEADELESENDSQPNGEAAKATLSVPGPGRRVTSNSLASQLYHRTTSSANTSRRSSCSDEIFDNIDDNFLELNDKVKKLEAQINMLTENQIKNDDRHLRMKEENSFLVERIHVLEEQLREVELKSHLQLEEEQRKYRELMSRTDKDKTEELEILRQSLQHIEREYQALKEEAPRLRAEVDRLRKDNEHLEDKLKQVQRKFTSLNEEHEEVQERARQQREEMEQEREVNAQLLDELSKELEELRNYRVETESRSRRGSANVNEPRPSRHRDLEAHVVRLKQDNAALREQNEDLHAQLLSRSIEQGRSLLANGASASLAAEIESLPRDELMRALKEQQEKNSKLQDYVDNIMLKIIDKNPSLLEVNKS